MSRENTTGVRSDGRETREHIIECAGKIFARDGYYKATSKEICEAAGVNQAAVNYHFGSRDGLYESVLAEAHRHIIDLEALRALSDKPYSAREKILAVLDRLMENIGNTEDWYIRVWIREILTPSPSIDRILEETALPKFNVVRDFWRDYLKTDDSARVYAAMAAFFSPFLFCLVGEGKPPSKHVPDPPNRQVFLTTLRTQAEQILDMVRQIDSTKKSLKKPI